MKFPATRRCRCGKAKHSVSLDTSGRVTFHDHPADELELWEDLAKLGGAPFCGCLYLAAGMLYNYAVKMHYKDGPWREWPPDDRFGEVTVILNKIQGRKHWILLLEDLFDRGWPRLPTEYYSHALSNVRSHL